MENVRSRLTEQHVMILMFEIHEHLTNSWAKNGACMLMANTVVNYIDRYPLHILFTMNDDKYIVRLTYS